ncbi:MULTISPECIES: DUF1289 domain-containing protein [unclassified Achromobacter]|uniref:DUF1289 domain-containing protein n=1 Tax=unclassified Achromobacter TaxID=2626865 RepID=UPI000B51549F|nr:MULTISPECIES: DUF1289 domain-containing protein [unclassified Achromobacter]OWT74908.1 DUF1289 domain-containing protein [Achromobacter sp. HZ28]OWT76516.1 DUF1289 domain-containing protein [Achromobacter sp. HZ34]
MVCPYIDSSSSVPEGAAPCADASPSSASAGGPATPPAQQGGRGVFTTTDSPCVAVCSTLYDDICRGCGRTAMEVAEWVFLSPEEKQVIWTRIRAEGYPRRKG